MSTIQILFWFLSGLALVGALMVILSKNPVFSVLWLITVFFAISGHYILLNAQFLAIVNLIVYAGAIMVLFLYVIMMLNLNKETEPHKKPYVKFIAVVASGLLMLTIVGALKGAESVAPIGQVNNNIGTVELIGEKLFSEFLLPFEISSILLLSAMIGSVYLSKKELN